MLARACKPSLGPAGLIAPPDPPNLGPTGRTDMPTEGLNGPYCSTAPLGEYAVRYAFTFFAGRTRPSLSTYGRVKRKADTTGTESEAPAAEGEVLTTSPRVGGVPPPSHTSESDLPRLRAMHTS